MHERTSQTERLLRRARRGEGAAAEELFDLHRQILRQMVALRMDGRLEARIDPSDVVQDALTEASRRFTEYLQSDDEQFYPWLRQIALDRLVQLHRKHVLAEIRSVEREEKHDWRLSEQSAGSLSRTLAADIASPSEVVMQQATYADVRRAIGLLKPSDREVLILRHVEQLTIAEVANVLQTSLAAAQSRYRRALERLHRRLESE